MAGELAYYQSVLTWWVLLPNGNVYFYNERSPTTIDYWNRYWGPTEWIEGIHEWETDISKLPEKLQQELMILLLS